MRTETRIVRGEVRAVGMAGKSMRVSGIAARYNNPTIIARGAKGSFKEILLTGAFRKAVYAKQNTAFLVNHDPNKLLGRVSAGTLRLQDTSEGLSFECDFPDTQVARDTYASIQRGDMSGCSFGFGTDVGDDEWSQERDATSGKVVVVRKIRNVSALEDVSAVTFPAYPNTSVNARSGFGNANFEFENRSSIAIPAGFVVDEDEIEETDSAEAIARRRQLLNIALL